MRAIRTPLTILAILGTVNAALAAGVITIDQKNLSFGTNLLQVAKGTKVVFKNSDPTSHNILIIGPGVVFNSGLQTPGVSFTAPFGKPGTYHVSCGIHPKMKMTVVVQ
jgi:cytochrome c peroxidase